MWPEGETDTQAGSPSSPAPTLPRDKWPFLQLAGGGHTLAPLSTMSQAIVLESRAPAVSAWERKKLSWAGVERSLALQGTSQHGRGDSVYFSARHGWGPASCSAVPWALVLTWGQRLLAAGEAGVGLNTRDPVTSHPLSCTPRTSPRLLREAGHRVAGTWPGRPWEAHPVWLSSSLRDTRGPWLDQGSRRHFQG